MTGLSIVIFCPWPSSSAARLSRPVLVSQQCRMRQDGCSVCYHTGCGIYYHITSGKPMPQILNVCRESIGDAWALKGGGVPTLFLLFR
jgi:hypothetical protein